MHLAPAKAIALIVFVSWATFVPEQPSRASDCNVIHDADERHMCWAIATCFRSECEFIQKPDLRQECRNAVEMWCHR